MRSCPEGLTQSLVVTCFLSHLRPASWLMSGRCGILLAGDSSANVAVSGALTPAHTHMHSSEVNMPQTDGP